MWKYVLRRLAQTIPVLLGVSVLVFAIMHFVPGDPVQISNTLLDGVRVYWFSSLTIQDNLKVTGADTPVEIGGLVAAAKALKGEMPSTPSLRNSRLASVRCSLSARTRKAVPQALPTPQAKFSNCPLH